MARGMLVALIGAIAMLASLVGWGRLAKDTDPGAVLGVMPWHSAALLQIAERARAQQTIAPAAIAKLGRNILPLAPLSEAPLVYAGLHWAAEGDDASAERAFKAAVKRQPRNIPALSQLVTIAIRKRDFESAFARLDQLRRVDPDRQNLHSKLVASFGSDVEGAAILKRQFDNGSPLAVAAVEHLLPTMPDIQWGLQVAAREPRFRPMLVERLMREQGIEAAFIAWLYLLPTAEARGFSWPYDPAFVGSSAPAPFNWRLFKDAEILQGGGLLVRYSGRGAPVFAQQTMLLAPGSYLLTAQMDGDLSGASAQLAWKVLCLPHEDTIGFAHAISASELLSPQHMGFVVPADNCSAQVLSLEGRPVQLPSRIRATVRHVSVERQASGGSP